MDIILEKLNAKTKEIQRQLLDTADLYTVAAERFFGDKPKRLKKLQMLADEMRSIAKELKCIGPLSEGGDAAPIIELTNRAGVCFISFARLFRSGKFKVLETPKARA